MTQEPEHIPPLIHWLQPDEREVLQPFFRDYPHPFPVLVDSVLSGYGVARVDNPDKPTVVQLAQGVFTLYRGDSTTPAAAALVKATPRMLVIPTEAEWGELILREFPGKVRVLPHGDHSDEVLDTDKLRTMAAALPEGLQIHRIDADLAKRVAEEFDNELVNGFPSPQVFAERGFGFCALENDKIICGATSYIKTDKAISVSVGTLHDYRRRGIGGAVTATLILHCLDKGLKVHWESANEESRALGKKLGFVHVRDFDILFPGLQPL